MTRTIGVSGGDVPVVPPGGDATEPFDALLVDVAADDAAGESLVPRPRGGAALVVAAAVLAMLGIGAIVAAAVLLTLSPGPEADVTVDRAAAPLASPTPAVAAAGDVAAAFSTPDTGGPPAITHRVDPVWAARVAEASGIPERALVAYAGAALAVGETYPGCGLGWNTLAAIGLVESGHGSHGGAELGADGMVTPRIVGVALDGVGVGRVPDTDGGRLDGDPVWDRAVGPMQFIPETWSVYARDGDGDGRRSIDQIDDAALSAAAYLCEVGGDVTVASNWIAAIAAYNPSIDYNHLVADAATVYASYR